MTIIFNDETNKSSSSQVLIKLTEDFILFHSPDTKTYASVPINSHWENHSIRSKVFSRLLLSRYYKKYKKGLNKNALEDAVNVLESRAMFEGKQDDVHVRVAESAGHIYIDLGNKMWEVADVTSRNWEITKVTPVKFIDRKSVV